MLLYKRADAKTCMFCESVPGVTLLPTSWPFPPWVLANVGICVCRLPETPASPPKSRQGEPRWHLQGIGELSSTAPRLGVCHLTPFRPRRPPPPAPAPGALLGARRPSVSPAGSRRCWAGAAGTGKGQRAALPSSPRAAVSPALAHSKCGFRPTAARALSKLPCVQREIGSKSCRFLGAAVAVPAADSGSLAVR